jgi:hypothetical protein
MPNTHRIPSDSSCFLAAQYMLVRSDGVIACFRPEVVRWIVPCCWCQLALFISSIPGSVYAEEKMLRQSFGREWEIYGIGIPRDSFPASSD